MLHETRKSTKYKSFTSKELLIVVAIIICLLVPSLVLLVRAKKNSYMILYYDDLRLLYKALQQYAQDFDYRYPTPSEWCDLLVEYAGVPEGTFHAFASGDPQGYATLDPNEMTNYPVQVKLLREEDDANGKHWYEYSIRWSHYAINPNAKLNSSPATVLLFETKGGWNQFGGSGILSTDHHESRKGCVVLFNDGSVKFIKLKDLDRLNWADSK